MQRNVLDYLENAVQKTPKKIAFADNASEITYQIFHQQVLAGGSFISDKISGQTQQPIIVFIDRNLESIVSFFSIVYSGNFYVPVDASQPAKRIELIIETLAPKAVIIMENQQRLMDNLSYKGMVIRFSDMISAKTDMNALSLIRKKSVDTDPLYAIFTSGSTGVPKGVLVSHRSVIDLTDNFASVFDFTDSCIFGNQAPFDFDVSVKDIYSTIKSCATMYIIPKVMFSFPGKLISFLNEKKINTVIWAASALRIVENLKALAKELPEYLKTVMFSGEVMPNRVLNYWRHYLPEIQYVNLYGPTEITCNCTYYKVNRKFSDDEVLPIGIPFENTGLLLLDENNCPAAEGEICIYGSSLALGYYNNPQKTAEAFCQNPLNTAYPQLIYRTGDLGKWDLDGNLLFLSRKDHQIKHMGHRIELGEIEIAANALSILDAAVCIYDEQEEKIVMFYQASEKCDRSILKELGKSLPKYMFPNKLLHFELLPLNKNGKIDRTFLKEKYITNAES